MKILKPPHRWNVSPRRAARIQAELRDRLLLRVVRRRAPRLVAGADVSYEPGTDLFHAAVVVLRFPELDVVEIARARGRARFPYVPGLLSFRESPIVLRALRRLRDAPDMLICDGQGIAHPRGFGLACHLGVLLGLPTIGCAKSLLVGTHAEPGRAPGSYAPLMHKGRCVGAALRTRAGVHPIFVSPGHMVGLPASRRLALSCTAGYRIPEPTRLAHIEVSRMRREAARAEMRSASPPSLRNVSAATAGIGSR